VLKSVSAEFCELNKLKVKGRKMARILSDYGVYD